MIHMMDSGNTVIVRHWSVCLCRPLLFGQVAWQDVTLPRPSWCSRAWLRWRRPWWWSRGPSRRSAPPWIAVSWRTHWAACWAATRTSSPMVQNTTNTFRNDPAYRAAGCSPVGSTLVWMQKHPAIAILCHLLWQEVLHFRNKWHAVPDVANSVNAFLYPRVCFIIPRHNLEIIGKR